MSIILPTCPRTSVEVTPRLITARNELRSAFGGSVQRVNRLGSRWAFDVSFGPMRRADALDWFGLLTETDTVVFEYPEAGSGFGAGHGAPLVKGASQAGSSLITDGWTPQFYIPAWKWFSVSVGGLLYSYQTTAAVIANGSGEATLPIRPMLRASPADNAALNVWPAKVEGFATLSNNSTGTERLRFVEGMSFTIEERR